MKRRWSLLLIFCLLLTGLPPAAAAQPGGDWHAWAYLEYANRLVLMDSQGEIQDIAAPTDIRESAFTQRYFGVSRDGARLVMLSSTDDERPMVLMHDLLSGVDLVWLGEPFERALPNLESPHAIPTLNFSPDNQLFAIGFSVLDEGTWRVVIFDTASATPLLQIRDSHPQVQAFVQAQPFAVNYVIPVVRLFDETKIHIQLVTGDREGVTQYPTLLWSPGDDQVGVSTYDRPFMDILPTSGEMVFPYADPAMPLPEPIGPVPPFNAINIGGETWLSGDSGLILNAHDAADGRAIVFQTQNPDTFERSWNLLIRATGAVTTLPANLADVKGVSGGILTIETQTGSVAFVPVDGAPGSPVPVMSIVPGDDLIEFVWVQPPTTPYAGPGR